MISIVSPVYNVEKYLEKFIQSILNQTLKDFELILVTDCPTDSSIEICEKYQRQDKRIRVIKQDKNGGVAKARNKGLSEVRGEYVMLADSDDYLPEDAIQYLYDLIKKDKSDIAMGGFYFDIDGEVKEKNFRVFKKKYTNKQAIKHHLNFRTLYGYPWGKLFRKEILADVKDPEDMSSGDDGVFSFLALANAYKISFSDHPVYYYRIRRDSLSGHNGDFRERDLDVLKQIDYVEKRLFSNENNYDKDFKIFVFGLLNGAIQKYENSSQEIKEKFYEKYMKMKKICDEYCNTVIFNSINPRMRLEAIQYKLKNK